MSPQICQLAEITDASAGGKALGLARLVSMGLPVPPAFVLRNASAESFPVDLDASYLALGKARVAVRSSALGEDGADLSFAGQYDTVLNVQGSGPLRDAIRQCVASAANGRAESYRETRAVADDGTNGSAMNIVVQAMVDARAAGVVFTADPLSGRRDLLLVDAVAGLGEALVSGEATPDHYAVDDVGCIIRAQHAADAPVLSDAEVLAIAEQARSAAQREGEPLDLEWAIDQDGRLFWLQARPITTLPADLNEFDTQLPRPDDVLTISNVSEMMPGAVCPLTGSFTGWSIDYGLQHMQVAVGARPKIDQNWQITAWAYGHLFLNLTGNIYMAAAVLGSTADQTAQTLCGRVVPELYDLPPQPLWRQVINTGKLLRYCLRAPAVVEQFGRDLGEFVIPQQGDSAGMWRELQRSAGFYERAMAVHIQSSALSGFLCSIVENMVSGDSNNSTAQEQGAAVRLLAGATDVESAVMLEELDALVDTVAEQPDALEHFRAAEPVAALEWLRETPAVATAFGDFLAAHGHRGYRELCMRDPAWREQPLPLVQSMQAAVNARLLDVGRHAHAAEEIDWASLGRGLRWVLPKAHAAIRRREHTKSQLVEVAHRFKCAFQHLGELLATEGKLPDADLVNFFSFDELGGFIAAPAEHAVAHAEARRTALDYQQRFEFPEISVGKPRPMEVEEVQLTEDTLHGRPASRGVVEGTVRVAHTLAEAAQLQPGEILVTPITDIGWTPYFSLIGALVTDLGSAVSHGAVIAREYGLPCVVNTRQGTRFLRTGERVRVDGDSGLVERLAAS